MIRSTLTAVPRRLPAFWAKAAVLLAVTAVTTLVAEVLSWAVALSTLRGHDATLDLGAAETQRILLGGVLYLAGVALLAFAIGAIVRVSAGALASVLGLLLVVEVMFRTLPADFFRTVSPFLPATAGHQLLATQASIDQARAAGTAPVLGPMGRVRRDGRLGRVALAVAAVRSAAATRKRPAMLTRSWAGERRNGLGRPVAAPAACHPPNALPTLSDG